MPWERGHDQKRLNLQHPWSRGLSSRIRNILIGEGVNSREQLLTVSPHRLLSLPNFGRTSLRELSKWLSPDVLPDQSTQSNYDCLLENEFQKLNNKLDALFSLTKALHSEIRTIKEKKKCQ